MQDPKGIRIVADCIQLIEATDKPGIHIETKNQIKKVKNVQTKIDMRGKDIQMKMTVGDFEITVKSTTRKKRAAIGVMSSSSIVNIF